MNRVEYAKNRKDLHKFKISLKENGVHSLWRGIESFENYGKNQDAFLLKDAIMFFHHGIELLMKEVLIKNSQFLIFEDLKDASKKQKQADNSGVGIFFLSKPPKTVTYEEAINRVESFIKPIELTDNLRNNLSELNRLRNQLEHYAIDEDSEEVTKLLAKIHKPLLTLFEAQIGGIKKKLPRKTAQAWNKIHKDATFYSKLEEEVFKVVSQFNGQKIPGELLGIEGSFTLPSFDQVLLNYIVSSTQNFRYEIDILGKIDNSCWAIEVKDVVKEEFQERLIEHLNITSRLLHNAQSWIVAFSEISEDFKETIRNQGIFITGRKEWKELEHRINSSN